MILNKRAFFKWANYFPHAGQERLHYNKARYRVLACGSRWGKSWAAAREAAAAMMKPNSRGWVVGPTYALAAPIFKELVNFWLVNQPDFVSSYSLAPNNMHVKLKNGAEAYAKSADNLPGLLGVGLDWVIFDECAESNPEAWDFYLRRALIDRNGWALFTSTPKGSGWYKQLFNKGKNPEYPEYYSQEGSTFENTHLDLEALRAEEKDWPQRAWEQEVLGKFVDDQGAVFAGVRRHIQGELEEPVAGQQYAVGVDLGKHQDYTVITVMKSGGHVCYWYRAPHETSWNIVKQLIKETCKKYNNATAYTDSSGIGDPIIEDLVNIGAPIMPVPTAQEKVVLIDSLSVALMNDRITYPNLPILLNELEIYEHTRSETGRDRYNAPEGFHDDCCFIAGTQITTPRGQVYIEQLRVGDEVMTRKGARRINGIGNRLARVVDRYGLTGTPEHPVFTVDGIKGLKDLKDTDITYTWNLKSSSTTESPIGATRSRNEGNSEFISGTMGKTRKRPLRYTGKSGLMLTDQSRAEWSYTTKMVTPSTTTSPTSPCSLRDYIHPSTRPLRCARVQAEICGSIVPRWSPPYERPGGEPRACEHTGKEMRDFYATLQNTSMFASLAERNTAVPERSRQSTVLKNADRNTARICRVYNLSVEDEPEYFANGLLVHNCISLALAWRGIGGSGSWSIPGKGL